MHREPEVLEARSRAGVMFLVRHCCELVVARVARLWKCCLGRSATLVWILWWWTWLTRRRGKVWYLFLSVDDLDGWWEKCVETLRGCALVECRESELIECHEFHFCLAWWCTVFTAHAFAWLNHFLVTVCHVCLLRLVSSTCHSCPLDVDYSLRRLGEISI